MLEYTWQPRKTLINSDSTIIIRDLNQNIVAPPQAPAINGRNVTVYVPKEGRYFVSIKSQTTTSTHRVDINDTSNDTGPGITSPLADPERPGTYKIGNDRLLGEEASRSIFDQSMLGVHSVRVADVRRSKGGTIGTNGKGVIAWRIDHQIDAYRSTIWPILRDRGMVAGLGVVTDAVNDPADPRDPTTSTWAQVTTAHWEGNEIWAHSASHADPAPYGGLSVEEEILKPRTTLEAQNLHPVGWQMPGVAGVQTPNYSNAFNTAAQFASRPGQLLLGTYGLIEIDRGAQGNRRVLPTNGCLGLGHYTIDTVTLAQAKAQVDLAKDYGMGVEIMLHPKYIGMSGYMSVADFTALVDYVKGLWDAGSIEVLSPSGLAFADPGQTRRLDLIRTGGFEGVTPAGLIYGPWTANNATGITIQTSGGQEGNNFARFSGSVNYLHQGYTFVGEGNMGAAAFIFEAWVRNASASTSIARMQVTDNSGNNPTFSRDVRTTLTAGQTWTKVRVPFCIPKTCTNVQFRLSRFTTGSDGATGDVDFDNVKVLAA